VIDLLTGEVTGVGESLATLADLEDAETRRLMVRRPLPPEG